MQDLDPIQVEVLWNRLIGIVKEQATVLISIAFTNIISDAGDLSAGIPGHINSMAIGQRHFLAAYPPGTLAPGDVLISNDPHQFSGHLHDCTISTPIFRDGRLPAPAGPRSKGQTRNPRGRVRYACTCPAVGAMAPRTNALRSQCWTMGVMVLCLCNKPSRCTVW